MLKSLVTIGLAAASVATIAGLAGCGSSAPPGSAPPAPPATSAPAAPPYSAESTVAIVRQAGATPDLGEVNGPVPGGDWWSAAGSFPPPPRSGSAEYVDVRTFPAGTTSQQAIAELGYDRQHNTPPDDQVVITGSGFVVIVSPAEDWNRPDAVRNWPVPPATIAARVHGTVLSPAS